MRRHHRKKWLSFRSASTLLAYQSLPSLQAYLLVEQEARRVELYRRATDWRVEYHDAGEIWLDCLELALPLAEVYADV